MIDVTILAKNYGDKSGQMTVQDFRRQFDKMSQRSQWAIFAEDKAHPDGALRVESQEVTDGMKVTVVPQMAGGSQATDPPSPFFLSQSDGRDIACRGCFQP